MNPRKHNTNLSGDITSKKEFTTIEKVKFIELKINNILLNRDDQISALYKVFFEILSELHLGIKEDALLIPVASKLHADKYVYSIQSSEEEKHFFVTEMIGVLQKIHDTAVNCINSDKVELDSKLELLRSIKPPMLLTDFHSQSTVTVNVSESKSVRKLRSSTYKGILQGIHHSLSEGIQDLKTKNAFLIPSFVSQQNQAKKLISKIQSIDPNGILLLFFRYIFSSLSYRLRYVNKDDKDIHHNICNGIILVDPPTSAQLIDSKRKPRKDKKKNISCGIGVVGPKGNLMDAGLHFCISDAEKMLTSGNYGISLEKLNSIFN